MLTPFDTKRVASSGNTSGITLGGGGTGPAKTGSGQSPTYTYELTLSQTNLSSVVQSGIPSVEVAANLAQNYQLNSQPNPPVLYLFSVSSAGVIQFVQAFTPSSTLGTSNVNLEIKDYYGNTISNVQFASLAKAQVALLVAYTIVPPPGIGATGTYLIYDDATSAMLAYGSVIAVNATQSPQGGTTQPRGASLESAAGRDAESPAALSARSHGCRVLTDKTLSERVAVLETKMGFLQAVAIVSWGCYDGSYHPYKPVSSMRAYAPRE